ncbi:MAG: G5 domain-containing protein [Solirubrobacteraceae bacterium]|nr:G5 domain-containing protein [Solirubrobacteraceae bacterium]
MHEFKKLMAHLGALIDDEALTRDEAAVTIARHMQQRLRCSRMSIWALEGEAGARTMRMLGGFDGSTQRALATSTLLTDAEFGPYFDALVGTSVCACTDTLADERLRSMRDSYLVPNDVRASLDATIGVNGTKVTTYRVKYVDGEEVSRELASEAVTVAPVNEVTSNGTRQPAPVPLVQAPSKCDGNYEGVCVPIDSDVDCEGGSGDGPSYIDGPLRVVGTDVYDLDRDGDGIACDK